MPSKQCDDGNTISGDGCDSICNVEPICGNGVVESGEGCDDGNTFSDDGCSSTCQNEFCGDGIQQANEEVSYRCRTTQLEHQSDPTSSLIPSKQCDDGNTASDDGCSSVCRREFCGDGIQQANEEVSLKFVKQVEPLSNPYRSNSVMTETTTTWMVVLSAEL